MRGASTGRVTVAAHLLSGREALKAMLYAAIDIHKRTFQAAVLDVETGEMSERRFGATREDLNDWAMPLQGRLAAVAIEATNGWRWVWRELSARGFDVRLADPAQAKALRGRVGRAKTDRSDARWLCVLLPKEMLPESSLPPGGDPDAARPDEVAQGAGGGSHPLGAATARAVGAGGVAVPARAALDGRRAPLGAPLSLSPAARAQVERLLRLIEAVESELR